MDIRKIFGNLINDFDTAWFQDAESKFLNHPSNKNHASSFSISVEKSTEDGQFEYQEKIIELEDFLLGAKDDYFDTIHNELQEDEHVEIVGEIEPGEYDLQLKEGHEFHHSSTFYPTKNLKAWHNELLKEFSICLKFLSSLKEQDVFINYVANECRQLRQTIEELSYTEIHKQCLKKVLDKIQNQAIEQTQRIETLQTIIFDYEERLPFNLSATQLNKLLLLFIEKGYLDIPKDNVTKFFERHCTVLDKGKRVNPISLSSSFRRLYNKKNSASNKAWARSINLNL